MGPPGLPSAPERRAQPITIGHMQRLRLLELIQQLPGHADVVAAAFKLSDNPALFGYVLLASGNVQFRSDEVLFQHDPVHCCTVA